MIEVLSEHTYAPQQGIKSRTLCGQSAEQGPSHRRPSRAHTDAGTSHHTTVVPTPVLDGPGDPRYNTLHPDALICTDHCPQEG